MKKQFKNKFLVTFFLLFVTFFSFAQLDNDQGDIEPPPPTVPIDGYVIPFAFVAIFIGAFYIYKANLKKNSK